MFYGLCFLFVFLESAYVKAMERGAIRRRSARRKVSCSTVVYVNYPKVVSPVMPDWSGRTARRERSRVLHARKLTRLANIYRRGSNESAVGHYVLALHCSLMTSAISHLPNVRIVLALRADCCLLIYLSASLTSAQITAIRQRTLTEPLRCHANIRSTTITMNLLSCTFVPRQTYTQRCVDHL